MKKVITTVGTSIFSNTIRDNPKQTELKEKYEEFKGDPRFCEDWGSFRDSIEGKGSSGGLRNLTTNIINKKVNFNTSAEIKSIVEIAKEQGDIDIQVVLLASDTILSVLACELICGWFDEVYSHYYSSNIDKKGAKIYVSFDKGKQIISGLQINDADEFKKDRFANLLKILDSNCDDKTILNITGGYKAIIPFMTIYAQLKKLTLKYVYEESNELITIGNLPLSFDWDIVEAVVDNLNDDFLLSLHEKDQLLCELSKLKLIEYENAKPIVSTLGKLMNAHLWNSPIGNTVLGLFLEYKFAYYFSKPNKYELYKPEKTRLGLYYAEENGMYEFSQKVTNKHKTEIGDADLLLEDSSGRKIWVELKALNSFIRFKSGFDLPEKDEYYRQIKPRILGFKHKHSSAIKEYVFIVYKTYLHKSSVQNLEKNNDFIEVNKYFKDKIEDDFKDDNIRFRILYCNIDLKISDLKINYSKLLQKPFIDGDIHEFKLK